MLESIFILTFSIAIITMLINLIVDMEDVKAFILSFVSILFLLYTWAGTSYIEVPSDTYYIAGGLGFLCFGLIIINVILALVAIIRANVEHRNPNQRY